ncbi:MAG: tetratricopeptide repeat protein [Luteolibacter sp.]
MSRRYSETHRSVLVALALLPAFAGGLHAQAVDLNRALSEGAAAYQQKDYAKAISSFSTIIKANPDQAPQGVYYQLAFSYYGQLQYQDAANTFLAYLKKYPTGENAAEVHLYLGRALLQIEGKVDEALVHLAEAAKKPEYAEDARFAAVEAYLKKGDKEKAAKALEVAMNGNSSGPSILRASLQLVDLYIEGGEFDKAIAILDRLENSPGYPDVIVTVNHRFVQIGDKRLEAKEYAAALAAYSNVRPRAQVIAIQTKRLAAMKSLKEDYDKRIANSAKTKQPLPRGTEDKAAMLAAMMESTEKVLGEVKGLTEYDATLQYRIGRCYFNMDRYWPASVAFEAVATGNAESSDAPTALFGAVICQWKLQRSDATRALCATYLKKYPKEKHVEQVANLNATLLLQEGKTDEVIAFLDPFLQEHPDTPIRKDLLILLANSRFQGGKYDDAAKDYDALKKEFASAPEFEEFVYRRALCDFLRNDYKATVKGFDAYEKDYPTGDFRSDIRYRRGIIQLALKDYDKLIASMNLLLKDPKAEGYSGQVHTLLADAYSARGNPGDSEMAATEYATALRTAHGDENVISYSLEQATNLLRGSRRWDELQALWQDFLEHNPNHPLELRGVSELSKLLARANKKEEARAMLAKYVLRDVNNVRSEYVEMLLSQLAGLYVPPRTFKKDAPKPEIDALLAELTKQVDVPESERTPTYIARVNFGKAELARMMNDPVRNARFLNAIASSAKSDDLGPILLSVVGQFLLDDKQLDKAVPLFTRLRDAFPDSSYSDAAPVGLGRIYLAKKEYASALEQFDFALNRAAGSSMLKEATYGKGMALVGLRKWDDARKSFEDIVGNKEWSGIEKAGSVFQLGEIAAQAGDKGAANVYFQKVYLSHAKYVEFAAKAYLRSAEMLEADGKHDAAVKTYREMVANPKYADTPEIKIARQKAEE